MTIRYVGPGGSDSNNGLSWANRKLTLNGVEDTPVVAGDIVYVGPGTYRETFTADVDGSSGNPIVYIGDVTGINTDGIGGRVRVTGSDDDQTATRANIVYCTRSYRTFRGFHFDSSTDNAVTLFCPNLILEDCVFDGVATPYTKYLLYLWASATGQTFTVRRCLFLGNQNFTFYIAAGAAHVANAASVVENCILIGPNVNTGYSAFSVSNLTGYTIRNCTIMGFNAAWRENFSSGTIAAENNVVHNCTWGIYAQFATGGYVAEDYNTYSDVSGGNFNSAGPDGANTETKLAIFEPPQIRDGFIFDHDFLAPSIWDHFAYVSGGSQASDDFYGFARPTSTSKRSRGAIQHRPAIYSTENPYGDNINHIRFPDAGIMPVFVPVRDTPASLTVSVYALHAKDYAGTLPQMIIREPGQSDRVTTDTGNAKKYNLLTDTFTPSGDTDYFLVILKSDNTATSGDFYVDFSDFDVAY